MCDENTVEDLNKFLSRTALSRRQFGTLTGAAAMAMLLPSPANAQAVTGTNVLVETPDGMADCYFAHPASGRHPGVIVWPDALGLRPAFEAMGRRLAESGYAVLTVNQYYRLKKAPIVPEGASFSDPGVRETLGPVMRSITAEGTVSDAEAFVAFLDGQAAVDPDRKIGTTGYCMGGPMTMRTAAAIPERIGAGASFHGGGLVSEGEDSPHLLIPQTQASFLYAIAANDDERQPEAKDVLRAAYDAAGLDAEIEVYEGAMHGWCPPDSGAYNEAQAERAWSRLLVLFEKALGPTPRP